MVAKLPEFGVKMNIAELAGLAMIALQLFIFNLANMAYQHNLLTALGCSGSVALVLSMATPVLASPVEPVSDRTLPSLTQADDNPILDALSCSCARCVMGQTANL